MWETVCLAKDKYEVFSGYFFPIPPPSPYQLGYRP
jgi:hypothetical protein